MAEAVCLNVKFSIANRNGNNEECQIDFSFGFKPNRLALSVEFIVSVSDIEIFNLTPYPCRWALSSTHTHPDQLIIPSGNRPCLT